MTQKLDKIDLRILYELDRDCRQPLSNIAKKIRKSPAYVKYHIGRLKEEQVIKAVSIIARAHAPEVYCFIKLKGSDLIQEKVLLDFLFKMPETYRLYHCDGEFDIVSIFLVKDNNQLNAIKNRVTTNFSNIDRIFFNATAFSELYTKKYLTDAMEPERIVVSGLLRETEAFEKAVLAILQKNPFSSLLEISTAMGVSYDRIKYLFKTAKPYAGSRLLLSEKTIRKAILFIELTDEFDKLKEYSAFNPNVVQIDNIIGEYNFAIFFECQAQNEIKRPIKEFLYQFKDAIGAHTKCEIINTYKYWGASV